MGRERGETRWIHVYVDERQEEMLAKKEITHCLSNVCVSSQRRRDGLSRDGGSDQHPQHLNCQAQSMTHTHTHHLHITNGQLEANRRVLTQKTTQVK